MNVNNMTRNIISSRSKFYIYQGSVDWINQQIYTTKICDFKLFLGLNQKVSIVLYYMVIWIIKYTPLALHVNRTNQIIFLDRV